MSAAEPTAGQGHARALASGSLAQQLAQVSGLLAMFAVLTVLARTLSLSELGVYGLLASLAGYLLVVQNAAAGAAVRMMAAATEPEVRVRSFSTAIALYALAGLAAGLLILGIGAGIAGALDLSAQVERQARLGAALLGLVTFVGWPITAWRDALRASGLLTRAAAMDVVGVVAWAALVLSLAATGAGLAVLSGVSGAIPLLAGLAATVAARRSAVPFSFSSRAVSRDTARRMLALAGFISLTELANVAVYAVDRLVLGLVRSAATVALFEGPIRAGNLVRSLNAAVVVTALPNATRYAETGDVRRQRELLVRGARYTLALVVPLAVTGMLLAGPILGLWLGETFRRGAGAMAILLSWWVVSAPLGVLSALLIGAGRASYLARYAVAMAAGNLALALALTPSLGLEGVAIATAVPYLVMFCLVLRRALAEIPTEVATLVRQAWGPALLTAAPLAGLLAALRLGVDLHGAAVVAPTLAGPLLYWAAYYAIWLRPEERALVGLLLGRGRGRRSRRV